MRLRFLPWLVGALVLGGTACAGGTQAARPTVQPNATAVATTAAASTAQTARPVQIIGVQVTGGDAAVLLRNVGGSSSAPVEITGWTLQAGTTSVTLPERTIGQQETIAIHTSSATPPDAPPGPTVEPRNRLFLGPQGQALRDALQPGTVVRLLDHQQRVEAQFTLPQG